MRDNIYAFKQDFSNVFKNNLSFDQIRSQIYYEKQTKKKFTYYRLRYSVILLLIIILGGVFLMVATNKTRYRDNDMVINFYNAEAATKWADYVFIARVEKNLYTKKYDGSGHNLPYTYFSLTDIEYLKGEGANEEKLLFYGGYDLLNNKIVFIENDIMPEEGQCYLFLVRRVEGSSYDNRSEIGSFAIQGNGQKLILDGYNANLPLDKQTKDVQDIINRYLPYIQ